MIEKMKVVHIVAAQTQKTELLDALRALGIVHFAEKADADQTYLERFAALSRLITVLEEQGVSEVEAEALDDVKFKQLYDGLNACLERKKALETERAAAVSACDTLSAARSSRPPQSTCPASASSCSKRRTTRTTPPCAIPRRAGTDSCG